MMAQDTPEGEARLKACRRNKRDDALIQSRKDKGQAMFGFLRKKHPIDVRSDELCAALLPLWLKLIDTVEGIAGPFPAWHEAGIYVGAMVLVELESHRAGDLAELRKDFVARWLVHVEMAVQDRGGPAAEQLTQLLFAQYPRYKMISEDADGPAQQLAMQLFARCTGEPAEEEFAKVLPAVDPLAKLTREIRARARLAAGH